MEEIKPTYVTFEQAEWLKEKGFNEECQKYYYEYPERMEMQYGSGKYWENEEGLELQPYKLLLLSNDPQPHRKHGILYKKYQAPEQWQVVEWLRVNHKIDLQAICNYTTGVRTYRMGIIFINKKNKIDAVFIRPDKSLFEFIEFNSPQEAYSAAFNYIKNNNLI
jgi:hypothetical protein